MPNPDIIAAVANQTPRPFCVGFAAETQNSENYAHQKLIEKRLDLIALNDVSKEDIGFDAHHNALTVFTREASIEIAKDTKEIVAIKLLKIIREHYQCKQFN